jgi:hypothetical protein
MSAVLGRAWSASRRLGQADACQAAGAAQGIGHPVPAGHVPDQVGGVGGYDGGRAGGPGGQVVHPPR